jgi:hypothetical protein
MASFRLHARHVATLLLVAWASLAASTAAPHHDDCHDTVCLTAPAGHHDPTSHRFEGPSTPDEHPLHCVVCHWIRAFKPAGQSTAVQAASTPDVALVHVEPFATPSAFPAAQPPLRAPPLAPLA